MQINDQITSSKASTRSMYDRYISGGKSQSEDKSHFERPDSFRSDLSKFKMDTGEIIAGLSAKWDIDNCSGVPLDYDPKSKTVFIDGSDNHTLLIGATGSKKSRLVVMPSIYTIAATRENMVISDPKGEIYNRSSGYLKKLGYKIHTINFRTPQQSDHWNIFQIAYEYYSNKEIDKACEMINDITVNLIQITPKDPYWDYSARDMLFGLVMLLFKIGKEKKWTSEMISIRNLLRLKVELFKDTNSLTIKNSAIWKYAKEDELVRTRLGGIVICPSSTMSCIISVFDQHMSCFSLQPQLTDILSDSTITLEDVGFKPCAIYLVVPDEKTTFHKIVSIFLKQIYELLIENAFKKTPANRFPLRINFILDEFSSLPTISDFPQMIAASRSRNIRFILVVQSKHQLRQRYENETETIMSNCSTWMFLTSRELDLLREISELSGTVSKSQEKLISVSRLQHLDKEKGECLVFCGRKYPYLALLPDIDEYDNGKYSAAEYPHVIPKPLFQDFPNTFFEDLLKKDIKNNIASLSHLSEIGSPTAVPPNPFGGFPQSP